MRRLWLLCMAMTSLAFHPTAFSADLVALVDLEFIRATDDTAAIMCLGDREEDCIPWARFYEYKAKVRKIFKGTEPRKTFIVKYGRHALREVNLRGVLASMDKLKADDDQQPQYQITRRGVKRELVCFEHREDEDDGLVKDGDDRLTCYPTKPREQE